jgi:hypothetical protein
LTRPWCYGQFALQGVPPAFKKNPTLTIGVLSGLIYTVGMFAGVTAANQWFGGFLKADVSMVQLIEVLGIFLLQPVILVAVSLFFSACISTLNSGIVMVMMYVISMIGGFIEQIGCILQQKIMVNIGIVTSLIFPSDSLFRKMMTLLLDRADNPISFVASMSVFSTISVPSDLMIIYAVVYGACALLLAARHFARRDL